MRRVCPIMTKFCFFRFFKLLNSQRSRLRTGTTSFVYVGVSADWCKITADYTKKLGSLDHHLCMETWIMHSNYRFITILFDLFDSAERRPDFRASADRNKLFGMLTLIMDEAILSRKSLLKSAASSPQCLLIVCVVHWTYSSKELKLKKKSIHLMIDFLHSKLTNIHFWCLR